MAKSRPTPVPEKAGWIDDELVAKMGELGLLGMVVPEEWGGTYVDYVAYAWPSRKFPPAMARPARS